MTRFGLFAGSGIDYAVHLSRLVSILPGQRCYLLPKLPPTVTGVVANAGQLVPLLDLAQLLGTAENLNGLAAYQVLVESECGKLALPATQTCGIVAEQKGHVIPPGEATEHGLAGEFCYQQRKFKILDIDSLAIGLIQESW